MSYDAEATIRLIESYRITVKPEDDPHGGILWCASRDLNGGKPGEVITNMAWARTVGQAVRILLHEHQAYIRKQFNIPEPGEPNAPRVD